VATSTRPKIRGNSPPYISFKTFAGFLQKLKETTVPGRVDSSVLRKYAGSVARQLVLSLKYLRLLDPASNSTTERLKKLVAAYGTPAWKEELNSLVTDVYQPIIGPLDLSSGTHQQLLEAFRSTGADGTVLDRAVAFFLAAAKEAEMPVSPHFTDRPRRPRSSTPKKAAKRKADLDEDEDEVDEEEETDIEEGSIGTKSTKRSKFQIAVPGKRHATIWLPGDVSSEDWSMIDLMMQAYVARLQKAKQA
jgi:hypothetical protein